MKIIVLMGSPNRNGSTSILVESFKKGAVEAGHSVERIDVCHAKIHPCIGCVQCGYEGPCVQKDDVNLIRQKLLAADMAVFATPLYYYGMSAQLKTVVDRFCAFNSSLNSRHLKSALLTVAWNADDWTFEALEAHYKTLVRYLNLRASQVSAGFFGRFSEAMETIMIQCSPRCRDSSTKFQQPQSICRVRAKAVPPEMRRKANTWPESITPLTAEPSMVSKISSTSAVCRMR